jgi:hypothetical protein
MSGQGAFWSRCTKTGLVMLNMSFVVHDPSLPILNVGCPVANGSKADAPTPQHFHQMTEETIP